MSPKNAEKCPPRLFVLCFVALPMKIVVYVKNTQKIHTFDRLVKPTDMCIFSIKFVGECVFLGLKKLICIIAVIFCGFAKLPEVCIFSDTLSSKN
jgi:hypothetical protein